MGSAGTLIVGIILVILGAFLLTGIVDFLVDMMGWIVLVIGVLFIVFGLFHLFAGGKKGESGY